MMQYMINQVSVVHTYNSDPYMRCIWKVH